MAEKSKAKFSVGQVVIFIGLEPPMGCCLIMKPLRADEWCVRYESEGEEINDVRTSGELRPLTSREIGPRPRPQPTKRGR